MVDNLQAEHHFYGYVRHANAKLTLLHPTIVAGGAQPPPDTPLSGVPAPSPAPSTPFATTPMSAYTAGTPLDLEASNPPGMPSLGDSANAAGYREQQVGGGRARESMYHADR